LSYGDGVPVSIVFETHATTLDNEAGRATGWLPGELSALGREQARALGERRAADDLAAVFTSDLARATQTAAIAFGAGRPVLADWRLRECDYGEWNGLDRELVVGARARHLDQPYPGGESWQQAVTRAARFLTDLPNRWAGRRVLVIGHVATRYGLDVALTGRPLTQLLDEEFVWQEGWEYQLPDRAGR
jgi:alpha-ribazole phosphatase/probable phosphoglycerate mutase